MITDAQTAGLRHAARIEDWPLAHPFAIAYQTVTDVSIVVVELVEDGVIGRGESCPTPRYGENARGVLAQVGDILGRLRSARDWNDLHDQVPAGAARNAVDCAIWDLRAKQTGASVAGLFGWPEPGPVETVFTLSLDAPDVMAAKAAAAVEHGLFKLKLGAPGGDGDLDRVRAVRAAAPTKRLIADVNEGWTRDILAANLPVLAELGVEMLEQPLPAGHDAGLDGLERPIRLCADESCHVAADVIRLAPLYDMVNIKLDKTGGLTEAMRLLQAAKDAGLETMVGCMLGTSLAMAPAHLVAQACVYADLDAPLLIGSDREGAMIYAGGQVQPADRALWG